MCHHNSLKWQKQVPKEETVNAYEKTLMQKLEGKRSDGTKWADERTNKQTNKQTNKENTHSIQMHCNSFEIVLTEQLPHGKSFTTSVNQQL